MPLVVNTIKCTVAILCYLGSGVLALFILVSLVAFDGNPFKDGGDTLAFWAMVYGFFMVVSIYSFFRAARIVWESWLSLIRGIALKEH